MGLGVSPYYYLNCPLPNNIKSWFLTLNLKAMRIRDDCGQKELLSATLHYKIRVVTSNGTN